MIGAVRSNSKRCGSDFLTHLRVGRELCCASRAGEYGVSRDLHGYLEYSHFFTGCFGLWATVWVNCPSTRPGGRGEMEGDGERGVGGPRPTRRQWAASAHVGEKTRIAEASALAVALHSRPHLPRPRLSSNPLAHRPAMARMPGDDGYYSNAFHHIQAKQSVVIPNHRPPSPTRNLQDRQAPGVRPSALFALAVHPSYLHELYRSLRRPRTYHQMTTSTYAMRIPVAIAPMSNT